MGSGEAKPSVIQELQSGRGIKRAFRSKRGTTQAELPGRLSRARAELEHSRFWIGIAEAESVED